MAQFEHAREELARAGIGVAFIAGQSRRGLFGAESFLRKHPLSFPYLCDETREVLKTYGIYVPLALDGIRVARPSAFLLDAAGAIRFVYVGKNQLDRVSPERLLAELRARLRP